MSELKPCPFCGGEAVLSIVAPCYWVSCSDCCAETHTLESEKEAIQAWNTRTPDPIAETEQKFWQCAECGGKKNTFVRAWPDPYYCCADCGAREDKGDQPVYEFLVSDAVFEAKQFTPNSEHLIQLFDDSNLVGTLHIVRGRLEFEGDADASAKCFFDNLVSLNNNRLRDIEAIADKLAEALNAVAADDYRMAESCALHELLDDKISIAKQALSEYQAMKNITKN